MKRILLTLALVVLLALGIGAAALAAGSDEPADDPLISDLRPQVGGGGNADQVQ